MPFSFAKLPVTVWRHAADRHIELGIQGLKPHASEGALCVDCQLVGWSKVGEPSIHQRSHHGFLTSAGQPGCGLVHRAVIDEVEKQVSTTADVLDIDNVHKTSEYHRGCP